jgi:hypothetical protein
VEILAHMHPASSLAIALTMILRFGVAFVETGEPAAQADLGRPAQARSPAPRLGGGAQVDADPRRELVAQADSTSWVRRCTLPAWVMCPQWVVSPLEFFEVVRS